ncbi:hypothetical protein ABW19_dt0207952 [Dactylella cylindrospora]|nr:hypothetical protein ABW19_dt0207952 [Dactylella cylindrospora]
MMSSDFMGTFLNTVLSRLQEDQLLFLDLQDIINDGVLSAIKIPGQGNLKGIRIAYTEYHSHFGLYSLVKLPELFPDHVEEWGIVEGFLEKKWRNEYKKVDITVSDTFNLINIWKILVDNQETLRSLKISFGRMPKEEYFRSAFPFWENLILLFLQFKHSFNDSDAASIPIHSLDRLQHLELEFLPNLNFWYIKARQIIPLENLRSVSLNFCPCGPLLEACTSGLLSLRTLKLFESCSVAEISTILPRLSTKLQHLYLKFKGDAFYPFYSAFRPHFESLETLWLELRQGETLVRAGTTPAVPREEDFDTPVTISDFSRFRVLKELATTIGFDIARDQHRELQVPTLKALRFLNFPTLVPHPSDGRSVSRKIVSEIGTAGGEDSNISPIPSGIRNLRAVGFGTYNYEDSTDVAYRVCLVNHSILRNGDPIARVVVSEIAHIRYRLPEIRIFEVDRNDSPASFGYE